MTGHEPKRGKIDSEIAGHVGWVSIVHPTRKNALNGAMISRLVASLLELDTDPQVRMIVIRGAGKESFISGVDMLEFIGSKEPEREYLLVQSRTNVLLETLANLNTPVLAMINGDCIGLGTLIALQCDLRVASDVATFAIPGARLGIGLPFDAVNLVVSRIGPCNAAEMLLTGKPIDAKRALAMGLANQLHGIDSIELETARLAEAIASNAPLTLRSIKASIRSVSDIPASERRTDVDLLFTLCLKSQDFREGVLAFVEKRRPQFIGR